MAEKKKYNSILISGRKDETLTYSRYIKDEESGESVKETLDKKVNVSDELETHQIKNGAITNEKLAADSVGNGNIQDGSVSNEKLEDGSITNDKLAENSITKDKLQDKTIGVEKLDNKLRQTIAAATGLPEDLVETIQNVDDTLKDHQSQLDDKQSQLDDKQQQIAANDEDISLLQTRSTQMEETIKSIAATGGASQATAVTYNNEKSGLTAVNAQAAIDEMDSKLSDLAKDVSLLQTDVLTKSDLNINVNPSIFKYAGSYTNEGVWIDSSIILSSDYIYIGDNDNIFIDIRTDKNINESFNILALFDKDKKFVSYVQYLTNNSFRKATVSLKGKSVRYCRVSVLKALINDNLSVKITSKNEIEERLTNKEYLLGSLLQKTNLIYKEIAGYSVLNGLLESSGQQNFKVCVVPVQKGNTYHFYKNNNGKAQEHSANYLITNYLFKEYEGKLLTTGTGSSVTIEDDYAYLYVTYSKNSEAMISLSEQTDFIKNDNDTYLKVNEHDASIEALQTKVNEHDSSINELLSKNSSSIIEFAKHPIAKDISEGSVVISEVSDTSTITDGALYPVLKDNKPHGEVSDLYRYNLPVRPSSNMYYPLEYGIEAVKPNNIYLTTEFYFEGTEFEVKEPANQHLYLLVDDVVVGELQNSSTRAWVYQKVTFNETKKRHIKIRGSFYGIVTRDKVSKFTENRLLLAVDGDSITEGTACIYPKHSEYAWSVRVAEILNCDLLNGGVGGSGYVKSGNNNQANMVDRYDSYIGQFNPGILFVMGGLNDGTATQTWKDAVDKYWENVHNTFKGKYVIVASPYWPQTGKNEGISNMTDYLKSVALKYKYPFVDVYNGVTYDAFGQIIAKNSNGGLVNTTNYNVLYKEYVEGTQTDSTHINNITGHEYVGRYIANEIYRICHNDLGINI